MLAGLLSGSIRGDSEEAVTASTALESPTQTLGTALCSFCIHKVVPPFAADPHRAG